MKLHQFRDVVAIAEHGSLRAAARRLHLAQPALTRSLSELERELGAALFERQTRGMVPTPVGLAFIRRASMVLSEVRKAREEVEQLSEGVGGRVVVGLSIAPHIAMLPGALGPFRARYPGVTLDIIEGFYPTLEADLRHGRVDFYIGPRPDTKLPPELALETLFENTRMVLCRKGHKLAGARTLRDLVDAEWATTTITVQAETEFKLLFESHGLPIPRQVLRSQSALTLMVVLAHTDILAMVPVQWAGFDPASGLLASIKLRECLPAPAIVLVRRADMPLTPAATYLADLMGKMAPGSRAPANGLESIQGRGVPIGSGARPAPSR